MQCSWHVWFGTQAADLAFDDKRTIWGAAKNQKGSKHQTRESVYRSEVLAREFGI